MPLMSLDTIQFHPVMQYQLPDLSGTILVPFLRLATATLATDKKQNTYILGDSSCSLRQKTVITGIHLTW